MDSSAAQFFLSIRTPARTGFFTLITNLGSLQVSIIIFILVALFFLYKKEKNWLRALVVTLVVADGITYIAKILFHRARPLNGLIIETDYSFPSGHATIAVALYGFLIYYLVTKKSLSMVVKVLIWTVSVAIILLIGTSRLYLGVHYLTDVLAGYCVGFIGILVGKKFLHGNN